ncbi:MAG: hypothetical protein JO259_05235, partial [Mycobacterium sp.]|nr:hypothetical protein [Mycobacterium sp.]
MALESGREPAPRVRGRVPERRVLVPELAQPVLERGQERPVRGPGLRAPERGQPAPERGPRVLVPEPVRPVLVSAQPPERALGTPLVPASGRPLGGPVRAG